MQSGAVQSWVFGATNTVCLFTPMFGQPVAVRHGTGWFDQAYQACRLEANPKKVQVVQRADLSRVSDLPSITRPNTTCLPSKNGAGFVVMKNCEPLVLGPLLAMLSKKGLSCFNANASS